MLLHAADMLADILAADTIAADMLAADMLAADTIAADILAADMLAADMLVWFTPIPLAWVLLSSVSSDNKLRDVMVTEAGLSKGGEPSV